MKTIGCVIPCYRGGDITLDIINKTPSIVDYVVLIDDYCPNFTGDRASKEIKNKKLIIIKNNSNLGVGASVKKGIKYLLSINCEIIIKIDADGQINPLLINDFIKPLLNNQADAVKGNRFISAEIILSMPFVRLIGNIGLSFLNKLSTGYWELFDPTNGFIAFSSSALRKIRLDKIDNRYFFESDLLFECSLSNIYFKQFPMKSVYKDEISSLDPFKSIFRFGRLHLINIFKRLIYQYFILDFNAGSLELLGSIITFSTVIFYNLYSIYSGRSSLTLIASQGIGNKLLILFLISFQLFLSFIYFDSTQKPLLRKMRE